MKFINSGNIDEIIALVKSGGVIIFPTETSYGLGCDATNQAAVDKVFKIKGRASSKPLLIVVPDIKMAKKYLVWNDSLDNLAKKFWKKDAPPLTVVGEYNKSENLASGVVAKDNTVAVRVTSHAFLKFFTEKLGMPIVATSANLSGGGEIYDASEAIKIFANAKYAPDAIIDVGVLPISPPSTIVSVVGNNLKILRQGELIMC